MGMILNVVGLTSLCISCIGAIIGVGFAVRYWKDIMNPVDDLYEQVDP